MDFGDLQTIRESGQRAAITSCRVLASLSASVHGDRAGNTMTGDRVEPVYRRTIKDCTYGFTCKFIRVALTMADGLVLDGDRIGHARTVH
jgi:hypothetical protein